MSKPPPLLTQAQQDRERLATMARVFAKADRVLSGEDVTCTLADQDRNSAPAWTDGRAITFNVPHIGSVSSVDDIIKVTGVNYHELCHVLYTPRRHTALVQRVIAKGIFKAFNILEDQRIETLLVTKYASTKPFFVAVIMRYLLAHKDQWKSAFPLLHGRKYLPLDVRRQAEAKFSEPRLAAAFKRVIDEYRVLAFPRDDDKGFLLIEEFAALLNSMQSEPQGDPFGHVSGSRPDAPTQGKPQPHEGTAAKAAAKSKKEDEPESKDASDDQETDEDDDATGGGSDLDGDGDDENEDDDTDGDGGGDSDDDTDEDDDDADDSGDGDDDGDDDWDDEEYDLDGDTGGDQKGGKDGSSGDQDGDGDQEGDSDADSGKGGSGVSNSGSNDTPAVSDDDFEEMLNQAAQAAEQKPEVQQDAQAKQDSIVKGDGDTLSQLDQQAYRDRNVPSDLLAATKRFGKELRLLRDEQDPGWWRGQPTGRLNVGRAMRGDDLDTVWDRWDEGKTEATDIEVVVLLDFSYSMAGMMEEASQAMWALSRSFEDVGGKVTVLGFSSAATLMYDGNTKVHRTKYKSFAASGGTNPSGALDEALRILHKTRRKSRFLVSITDGQWTMHGAAHNPFRDQVERCNANGVVTGMLYLHDPSYIGDPAARARADAQIDWNGHQVRASSVGASDLALFAQGLVKARLKQPVR